MMAFENALFRGNLISLETRVFYIVTLDKNAFWMVPFLFETVVITGKLVP